MNSSNSDTLNDIIHQAAKIHVEESHLTIEALLTIVVLIIYTISSSLFAKYDFHYLFGSGICMIIGLSFTLISMIINPEVFLF